MSEAGIPKPKVEAKGTVTPAEDRGALEEMKDAHAELSKALERPLDEPPITMIPVKTVSFYDLVLEWRHQNFESTGAKRQLQPTLYADVIDEILEEFKP